MKRFERKNEEIQMELKASARRQERMEVELKASAQRQERMEVELKASAQRQERMEGELKAERRESAERQERMEGELKRIEGELNASAERTAILATQLNRLVDGLSVREVGIYHSLSPPPLDAHLCNLTYTLTYKSLPPSRPFVKRRGYHHQDPSDCPRVESG